MTARTASDHKRGQKHRRSTNEVVPLTTRLWVRLVGVSFIMSWLLACFFTSTLLTR